MPYDRAVSQFSNGGSHPPRYLAPRPVESRTPSLRSGRSNTPSYRSYNPSIISHVHSRQSERASGIAAMAYTSTTRSQSRTMQLQRSAQHMASRVTNELSGRLVAGELSNRSRSERFRHSRERWEDRRGYAADGCYARDGSLCLHSTLQPIGCRTSHISEASHESLSVSQTHFSGTPPAEPRQSVPPIREDEGSRSG